jgi:hypothetical protein
MCAIRFSCQTPPVVALLSRRFVASAMGGAIQFVLTQIA